MSGARTARIWLALALALSAPSNARAADEAEAAVARARALFDAGAEAYAAGRYAVAVQAFEEAHRLAPRPAILFSIAQAERKEYFVAKEAEHLVRAIRLYREYIGKIESGGRRVDAIDALAEFEPLAARLNATAATPPVAPPAARTRLMVSSQTPEAVVSLDGATATRAPLIEEVAAGKHVVQVSSPGYAPDQREVIAVSGTLVPLDIALRELPAVVTFDTDPGAEIAIDGRLVGAAPLRRPLTLAPGAHTVVVTMNGHSPFAAAITFERGTTRQIPAKLARTTQRTLAYVLLGSGAAGTIAGGVLLLVAVGREEHATQILDARDRGNISAAELEEYNSALAGRDRFRTVGALSVGAGVALSAAGAALFAFDRPAVALPSMGPVEPPTPSAPSRSSSPLDISVAPTLGPDLIGARLRGVF